MAFGGTEPAVVTLQVCARPLIIGCVNCPERSPPGEKSITKKLQHFEMLIGVQRIQMHPLNADIISILFKKKPSDASFLRQVL